MMNPSDFNPTNQRSSSESPLIASINSCGKFSVVVVGKIRKFLVFTGKIVEQSREAMAAAVEGDVPAVATDPAAPAEAATEPAPPAEAPADAPKPAAEENPKPGKEKKPRSSKAPKERKPRAAKPASPSHPPYFQMIKEAITAEKEKSGLSTYAIAKHMEEKYKAVLPANFRKTLLLQLKNCVAKGKLVKVKGSFKLSEAGKKDAAARKPVAAGKEKKAPKAASAEAPKPAKGKADAEKKKRKAPAGSKPAAKARAAKSAKVGVKKAKKAAPAKAKQPKSIKSPVAKRARRAPAA